MNIQFVKFYEVTKNDWHATNVAVAVADAVATLW